MEVPAGFAALVASQAWHQREATCTRNKENRESLKMIDFGVGTEIGFGVRATNRWKRFELGDEKILKNIFSE